MIKIIHLKKDNKSFTSFMKKEWELVNPEHYGKELEWNYWTGKPLKLDAKQGKEIIGGLKGLLMAGVLEVFQLIVRHDKLGMGIGKLLLDEAGL